MIHKNTRMRISINILNYFFLFRWYNYKDLIKSTRYFKELGDMQDLKVKYNITQNMCIGRNISNINLERIVIQNSNKIEITGSIDMEKWKNNISYSKQSQEM